MKEIVVISGKGGTGKTSITASFAILAAEEIVVADCDVDAADLHLLLMPDFATSTDFYSGELADIDPDTCTACGACLKVCRFDAISAMDNRYVIDPIKCEGCGYCARVCPVKAISNRENKVGTWYLSTCKNRGSMVHATLAIGAENSGKLVARVKNEAKSLAKNLGKEFVLVDGSPGIGCPVVSSLSGASFVVIVTEATVSGLHDMKRVYELVKRFHLKAGCIINKYDLNTDLSEDMEAFLKQEKIIHIANLPYDEGFTDAMVYGKTVMETETHTILKSILTMSWKTIKEEARKTGESE